MANRIQPTTRFRPCHLLVGVGLALCTTAWGEGFEKPPVLQAADVLPAALVESKDHSVAADVASDGFLNRYRVKSKWAEFDVWGTTLLEIRVEELHAMTILEEKGGVGDAVSQGVQSLGNRAVDLGKQAADDPDKFVSGLFGGIKKRFTRVAGKLDKTAKTAEKLSKGTEGAKQELNKNVKKELGQAKAERALHKRLGTDPYTRNESLRDGVREAAKKQALAKVVFDPISVSDAEGIARGAALERLYGAPPEAIRTSNREQLAATGAPETDVQRFLDTDAFTLTLQTLITEDLGQMQGVADLAIFLEAGNPVESEAEAYFVAQSIGLMAEHHQKREPLARAVRDPALFAAISASGKLVVFGATDHLVWTAPLAADLKRIAAAAPTETRELWLTGTVSDRCRQEIEALGFALHTPKALTASAGGA